MLDGLKTAARRASADAVLGRLLGDCRRLLSERGQANSVAIAQSVVQRLGTLPAERLPGFFERLASDFDPDPAAVLAAAEAYAHEPGAETLVALQRAAEPPRQELLRRINRGPGGTVALVKLRQALLDELPEHPRWLALESDLLHLLASWFNPGFLQLRRIDWNTPAQLLEQIIRHEAVHQIDGWDDLRRRLQPDRRLFGFFHPQLEGEPLIFVEVALRPEMPAAIAPLIDKTSEPLPPQRYRYAVFYSISNCQPGLRGVSLGNFLIKRVAEELQRELPQLRTFCTLSPVPGFARWLASGPAFEPVASPRGPKVAERAAAAHATLAAACGGDWPSLADATRLAALPPEAAHALERLAAFYLVHETPKPGGDPVARFHLDNGARLERIDPQGNLSRPGLRQSFGLMVNYLYDLGRVEASHEAFTRGEVVHSRAVASLL